MKNFIGNLPFIVAVIVIILVSCLTANAREKYIETAFIQEDVIHPVTRQGVNMIYTDGYNFYLVVRSTDPSESHQEWIPLGNKNRAILTLTDLREVMNRHNNYDTYQIDDHEVIIDGNTCCISDDSFHAGRYTIYKHYLKGFIRKISKTRSQL